MELHGCESKASSRMGDRSTSDVVVRLRTQDGRDEWFYCHSHILTGKSKYFADRLSVNWPTCQILDSRNCVEVCCQESDFDYHVTVFRLLYVIIDDTSADMWHGVRNALCILQVAVKLGCPLIITACVNYLEAVPWEEPEEEEILRVIPSMGSLAEPILSRLQPVNPRVIVQIFLSAIQFATSSPPLAMHDLKLSVQEQLEYMLTEDDDAPLVLTDDTIKSEVGECVKRLLGRFNNLLESLSCEPEESVSEAGKIQTFQSYLSDMSWAWQILAKLDILREFVNNWAEASEKILVVVAQMSPVSMRQVKLKVIEVAAKILEAIGYGNVILPTAKRLHMVKVWLPFVRVMKPFVNAATAKEEEDAIELKMDDDIWQSLESSFVSIILALPSGDQAEILTEWLGNEHVHYPDLTEAFEVWCYRSKVAKRRLTLLHGNHGMTNKL